MCSWYRTRDKRKVMSDTPSDFIDNSDRPTEELYIELRDLEAIESRDTGNTSTSGAASDDDDGDTSGIRERIAHLRSLLSDRGVIQG